MLDSRTVALIQQAYAGKTCIFCGGPAERLRRGGYYCREHFMEFFSELAPPPVKVRTVKDPDLSRKHRVVR